MAKTWTSFDALQEAGDSHAKKFCHIRERLNFEKLSARAVSVRKRNDPTLPVTLVCTIDDERFAFGRFNVVFILEFTDGVRWVARIPWDRDDVTGAEIRQEVAIMHFVRTQTTIPVPAVHDFHTCLQPDDPIGVQYILMDFVSGDCVRKKSMSDEQRATFVRHFADRFYQLSQLRFANIGEVGFWNAAGEFIVHAQATTETSPSKTSMQYLYEERTKTNLMALGLPAWNESESSLAAACQFLLQAIPLALKPELAHGPFPLTHMDMHENNILIDEDGQITGIIDWSSVEALPLELFAHHPLFITSPWLDDTHWQNIQTVKLGIDVATEFRRLAEEADDNLGVGIANLIGTARAELADGLLMSPAWMLMADARMWMLRLEHGNNACWNKAEKLIVNYSSFKELHVPFGIVEDEAIGETCDGKKPLVLGKGKREE